MILTKLWKRPGVRGALLGLLCGLVAWPSARSTLFRLPEEWLQDASFVLRGKRHTSARVLLVSMDDKSLERLRKPAIYTSPELAEVVTYLKEQGTIAIGLDWIIPDEQKDIPELDDDQPGDAGKLGRAILKANNVVLARWKLPDRWVQPLSQWQLKARAADPPDERDLAFVNLTEDHDLFVRRQQLLFRHESRAHVHFALALYAVARQAHVQWDEGGAPVVAGERVPVDDDGTLRINYAGPPDTFPALRFWDVLQAARGKGTLPVSPGGAVVIIGSADRGQQDYHPTPYDSNYWGNLYAGSPRLMSGPEIHANVVATLLDGAYVRTVPWPATLAVLGLFGALLGNVFARLSLVWGFVVAFVHHWGWKLVALAAFSWLNLRVEIMSMLLLGALAYGATLVARWWRLRHMLGVFKSEAIARLLEQDGGHLDLRGEERVVTVLFADIRGFTTFSEAHAARDVVALLNAYFEAVAPAVEENGGTLTQYMGDGCMVLFGAPAEQPDHALRAVRTAVAMVRRVHEGKERWAELDCPGLRIGVGVNTGRVIVGAVGSRRRLDYTAIGDVVNAAARIESQNKEWGTEILISSETYRDLPPKERQALGCSPESRPASVPGKTEDLRLHAVEVGKPAAADE
jgi:adenylate cyclase